MEKDMKRNVVRMLNSIPLTIGVLVAVMALTGWGDVYTILAILGIGLFCGAIGDILED